MDREKVIKGLRICFMQKDCDGCPYQKELKAILDKPHNDDWHCPILDDAIAVLQEQEARIQKYEYVFDFLGIGFRQWVTKILHGEAEVICETDEHEYKTVVTFKLI